jgi:hypothetical protein
MMSSPFRKLIQEFLENVLFSDKKIDFYDSKVTERDLLGDEESGN